jgi:hypothetical protein
MRWRAAIVAMIVGLWVAIGAAWGLTAALLYGFFVLIACLFAVGAIIGGDVTQQFGAWCHDRQLRGRRRR